MRKYQGKTRRRLSYIPRHVTEETVWSDEGRFNYQLEGVERKRKLHWWHRDHSNWFLYRPTAWFRGLTHSQVRVAMRSRMSRDHEDFEPVLNIRRFKNPVYLD